jgi:acyl carrier protein
MEASTAVSFEAVKAVVVETFGIEDRAGALEPGSALLGSLPELDSMGVLELVHELEQRFGIEFEGEDVSAEVFETIGTLTAFVDEKLR